MDSNRQESVAGTSQASPMSLAVETTGATTSNGESITLIVDHVPELPVFSAKPGPPEGEVDYRHWRRAAVRLKEDSSTSEVTKRKVILDSLQGKASDIVDFHRNDSLDNLLELLDSNYKLFVDGDNLLADFYQMPHLENQSASDYLSDLYIELIEVVNEGGTTLNKMPSLLLRQFERCCTDDDLLDRLKLNDYRSQPPSFPSLMSMVRREECRRTERKLRLKRMQSQKVELKKDDIAALQQRISELEALVQATQLTVAQNSKPLTDAQSSCLRLPLREAAPSQVDDTPPPTSPDPVDTPEPPGLTGSDNSKKHQVNKFPLFCFRCGLNFHKAYSCRNNPNKTLVNEKRRQFAEFKSESSNKVFSQAQTLQVCALLDRYFDTLIFYF